MPKLNPIQQDAMKKLTDAIEVRTRKAQLVITHSDQIKDLPWAGSFFLDSELFNVIDAYIYHPDTSVTERMNAMYGMGLYGMGVDDKVVLKELAEYLEMGLDAEKIEAEVFHKYMNQIRKYVPITYPVKKGQIVCLYDTGEIGVVAKDCPDDETPLVVNMGKNATHYPKISIMDHKTLEMQVYVNPDEEATGA